MVDTVPFRCLVSADLFRRAAMARGSEPTRYYLHGVHVEPISSGGVLMIATDGAIMLVLRDTAGWASRPAIVNLNTAMNRACGRVAKVPQPFSRAKKAMTRVLAVDSDVAGLIDLRGDRPADLEAIGSTIANLRSFRADIVEMQWREVLVDGAFPDWRAVVPRPVATTAVGNAGVDAEKLDVLASALSIDDRSHVLIRPSDEAGHVAPWLVTPCSGGKAPIDGFGVIMPMHIRRVEKNVTEGDLPSWFGSIHRVPSAVDLLGTAVTTSTEVEG